MFTATVLVVLALTAVPASAIPTSSFFIVPDVGSIGINTNDITSSLVHLEANMVSTKQITSLSLLYNNDPDNNPATPQSTLQMSFNGNMKDALAGDAQNHNFHLDWFDNSVTTLVSLSYYMQEGTQREQASGSAFLTPFSIVSSSGNFGNSFDNSNNVWLWSAHVTWVLESQATMPLASANFGSLTVVPEPATLFLTAYCLVLLRRRM